MGKIMRYVSILFTVLILSSCSTAPVIINDSSSSGAKQISAADLQEAEPSIQFLLDAAAAEFHAHGPKPVRFRDVYFGYAATGEKLYRICGHFQTSESENWVPFATIKTSDYEQWVGGQSAGFFQDPAVIWDKAHDLSSSLMAKLETKTNQPK